MVSFVPSFKDLRWRPVGPSPKRSGRSAIAATTTASGATVLHHSPGAAGQVTWKQQLQTGGPPVLIPVNASGMPTKIAKKSDKSRKEKNRLAGVRKAPAGQQSAAAAAAVPGRYQCEASPVPAPIQYPAGNFVQERQIDVDSETDSVLCLCRWLRRTGRVAHQSRYQHRTQGQEG
ncbi:hypothetical protein quinque_006554 [Culex quinquefasciatus]